MTSSPRPLDDQPTSLYRFYDANQLLLYIGITNCLPRRFEQHEDRKPWFRHVAHVTVEHHADRDAALHAEKIAIQQERPQHNIKHNLASRRPHAGSRTQPAEGGRWHFQSRRSGHSFNADLVLYPELDCSAMVDSYYDYDGDEQLDAYVRYLQRHYPHWLETDAVPIVWSVHSGWRGIFESAPFQDHERAYGDAETAAVYRRLGDFLTHFTWPFDPRTGEHLDWYRLPVVNDRFPDFAAALGWTPSPLQPNAPLRSIMASRRAIQLARFSRAAS
ncbi:GIY-YIG nuclease family protein [Nonomuraea sp. NPDC049646]|uniref:GIY-YIG nuclease family protein n=1 Tax=unclassified Nonomuraea TaxID=2593643 RepID=UPI0037B040F1